jgi:uncharacterized protein (DUF2235 family)
MGIQAVLEAFRQLSDAEKAEFLALLEADESLNDLSPEWLAAIDRRWKAFVAGEMNALDEEEADRQLIETYGIEI